MPTPRTLCTQTQSQTHTCTENTHHIFHTRYVLLHIPHTQPFSDSLSHTQTLCRSIVARRKHWHELACAAEAFWSATWANWASHRMLLTQLSDLQRDKDPLYFSHMLHGTKINRPQQNQGKEWQLWRLQKTNIHTKTQDRKTNWVKPEWSDSIHIPKQIHNSVLFLLFFPIHVILEWRQTFCFDAISALANLIRLLD